QAARVAQGLGLIEPGAGDRLPFRPALTRGPGRVGTEMHRGQATGRQMDDAARAVQVQAEPRAGNARLRVEADAAVADTGEVAGHALVKAVDGRDVVAGQGADALIAVADVRLRDGFAALQDAGEAPPGVAGQEAHEVHDVGAEDHEVFAAAALGVFLAAAA